MEDGNHGRTDSAFEDSMDTERNDDNDGGGDDDEEEDEKDIAVADESAPVSSAVLSHLASDVVSSAQVLRHPRLPPTRLAQRALTTPVNVQHATSSGLAALPDVAKPAIGRRPEEAKDPSAARVELVRRLELVSTACSSSSASIPSSSSSSSTYFSSSGVVVGTAGTSVEVTMRLSKNICDIEDPKPGPSNSAADFDLEVIIFVFGLFVCDCIFLKNKWNILLLLCSRWF